MPDEVPTLTPIEDASPSRKNPPPLARDPDVGAVIKGGDSTASRLAAETFALGYSQLVIDTRTNVDLARVLRETSSEELPQAVRDSVLYEAKTQQRSRTGRRWKTEDPMWIRSSTSQLGGRLNRVSVEIAGTLSVDDPTYIGWNKVRVDLKRQDDAWRVTMISAAPYLPPGALSDRSKVVLGNTLEGPGWREIAPKR